MKDFVKPLTRRMPDELILYVELTKNWPPRAMLIPKLILWPTFPDTKVGISALLHGRK